MLTNKQFQEYKSIINDFKEKIGLWKHNNPKLLFELENLRKKGNREAKKNNTKNSYDYILENSIVYNTSLNSITKKLNIKYIIIGDNPGKNEQLNANLSYLIGQAGKLARNFFINKENLINNFEKEILVLNKTPIHTPKTSDLKKIKKHKTLISETQKYMASLAYRLHAIFNCELWIIGYTELKQNKIFEPYLNEIKLLYSNKKDSELKEKISIFRHFSTNAFWADYKTKINPALSTKKNLDIIGKKIYRKQYLGW